MFKFSTLAIAKRFRDRLNQIYLIILGDDGKFWVATPKESSRLVKAGYEYAE